jgi:hypothetical protein
MKLLKSLLLFSAMIVVAAQQVAHASTSSPVSSNGGSGRSDVATAPEAALKKAMSASVVISIMGEPLQRKALTAPVGKAEVWIYRRVLSDRWRQVQTGTNDITTTTYGSDGKAHTQIIHSDPIYADEHTTTTEVISLLMFNDHYVEQKHERDENREFLGGRR